MSDKEFHLNVGDVFRLPAYSGGFRVWAVTGVYYGSLNQESVVGIVTLDRDMQDEDVPEMRVPIELLHAATPILQRIIEIHRGDDDDG